MVSLKREVVIIIFTLSMILPIIKITGKYVGILKTTKLKSSVFYAYDDIHQYNYSECYCIKKKREEANIICAEIEHDVLNMTKKKLYIKEQALIIKTEGKKNNKFVIGIEKGPDIIIEPDELGSTVNVKNNVIEFSPEGSEKIKKVYLCFKVIGYPIFTTRLKKVKLNIDELI